MKAVIIGGGIAGAFTAYFLKKAGVEVVGFGGPLKYPLTSLVLTLSMPNVDDIEMAKESLEVYKSLDTVKPITSVDILPATADLSSLRKAGVEYKVADSFRGLRLERGEVVVLTTDYLIPVRRIVERLRRELGFSNETAELAIDGRFAYAVAGGRKVKADVVVLAAGAENSALASRAGIKLPFKPYSCYAAVFLAPAWLRGLSVGDYVLSWYGRPGPWPLYIAGDGCGEAYRGPPPGYASKMAKLISRRAGWAIPLYTTAGVCEGSPTGGPLFGKVERLDNLYAIGGLDGYGSMVGPAAARRLTEAIIRGRSDVWLPESDTFDPCIERHDWGLNLLR